GGIISLVDQATGQPISDGSAGGSLWVASLDNNQSLDIHSYSGQFTHEWDEATGTLTLNYTGDLAIPISIMAAGDSALKMQASVTNNTGANVSSFRFPNKLKILQAHIQDTLLPMMPGALIGAQFFTEGRSFINEYPGVMFADYVALRSTKG